MEPGSRRCEALALPATEEVTALIDYYSNPILTARYLGMPESTLDVWLLERGLTPLVHAVRPERRGWPRVPFVGVIEAYVLRPSVT